MTFGIEVLSKLVFGYSYGKNHYCISFLFFRIFIFGISVIDVASEANELFSEEEEKEGE